MKRWRNFFSLSLVLIAFMGLQGCDLFGSENKSSSSGGGAAQAASTNDPALIGTWQLTTGSDTVTITASTWALSNTSNGCVASGTYSTSGSTMTWTVTVATNCVNVTVGVVITSTYSISGTTLTLNDSINGTTTYTKI